jgi:hypothetical protein
MVIPKTKLGVWVMKRLAPLDDWLQTVGKGVVALK